MEISAGLVKELREKTGVSMMECKKALTASNGDFEMAIKHLREKGIALVGKKADRTASEGRIFTVVSPNGKKGVILELSCETDFVAKSDDFINLGQEICSALAQKAEDLSLSEIAELIINNKPVKEHISNLVLKLGENISIKRVEYITAEKIANYIHSNGKIGVLIGFENEIDLALAKDIAMHIAAMNPLYLDRSIVPTEELNKEKEIIRVQCLNEGKPENVVDKIVEGRVNKYFQEVCLLEQEFVKEKQPVKTILKDTKVKHFFRFQI